MQVNTFRNCLTFCFNVQYFSKICTNVILLLIKAAMMATSVKLVLIFRREKGKRIREALLFLKKKEEILTLSKLPRFG